MDSAPRPSAILSPPVVPAKDFAEAQTQFATLQALDGDAVNPVCRSQLLTHDRRTDRAIVLIHGMTNCPQQYEQFASLLLAKGFNVLIPRMPANGLKDRNTKALATLTPATLETFGTQVINIACGLGERVMVAGISAGGVIAAWLAQFRPEVDAGIIIAPSFGITPRLRVGNTAVSNAATFILRALPNIMTQRIKPFTEGPPQGYFGFATHGLAAMLRMGDEVRRAARTQAPKARTLLLITNDADPAVNNPIAIHLAYQWEQRGARTVHYAFSADRKLIHDIIDPQQPQQQVAFTYPILLELIDGL
jgi:pimeloyl-ACP methyl ester carboxylesterase